MCACVSYLEIAPTNMFEHSVKLIPGAEQLARAVVAICRIRVVGSKMCLLSCQVHQYNE